MCDMVRGVEDLRFPLSQGLAIEKYVRGALSGPFTPQFVVDPPGGCGKRNIHSAEYYRPETGLSSFIAPSVKPGFIFLYADPLHSLSPAIRKLWSTQRGVDEMIYDIISATQTKRADLVDHKYFFSIPKISSEEK